MSSAPSIFDRDLIRRRLARRTPGRDDFVTRLVQADLAERLRTLKRPIGKALAVGPGIDMLPETGETGEGEFSFERVSSLAGEGPFPAIAEAGLELIVSLMDLQTIDDVPGYLSHLARHLRPDGLLLAAALGGDSLSELRRAFLMAETELGGGAHARVAPFIQLRDAGGLLQRAGLALPVADVESHAVRYAHPLALMAEIKALGASNPLRERPGRMMSRRLLAAAATAYQSIAGEADGRVRATLEIVWLSGWAPHESQQKPLRPGSARTSLAQVLGDKSN